MDHSLVNSFPDVSKESYLKDFGPKTILYEVFRGF